MAQTVKKNTILVVDDEEDLGDMLTLMLTRLGHCAVACSSPVAALHLMKDQPERFDLAIVDEIMPQMRGTQLTRQLLGIKDDLPVILLTGHGALIPLEEARGAGLRAVLTKPVLKEHLRAALERVNMPRPPAFLLQ